VQFTSEHKLAKLAEESGVYELIPRTHRETFDASVTASIASWHNSHRFRSEHAMQRFLKKAGLDRGIRGNYARENAKVAVSDALTVISLGVRKW